MLVLDDLEVIDHVVCSFAGKLGVFQCFLMSTLMSAVLSHFGEKDASLQLNSC